MNRHRLTAVPLLLLLLFAAPAWSQSATTLLNARLGLHPNFTRLVLDSRGSKPVEIGPASQDGLPIRFEQLDVAGERNRIFSKKSGAVARLTLYTDKGLAVMTAMYKQPGTQVKYFYFAGKDPKPDEYHLVLDFYAPGVEPSGPGKLIPGVPPPEIPSAEAPAIVPPAAGAGAELQTAQSDAPQPAATPPDDSGDAEPAGAAPDDHAEDAVQSTSTTTEAATAAPARGRLSGEVAGIVLPAINDDATSSLFSQYRDFNTVSGEWRLDYIMPERYYLNTKGARIGQEDQNIGLGAGWYGIFDIAAAHREIPHRFAFDARTLYRGVGSGTLTLDDGLQNDLQGLAADPVGQANRLNIAMAGADMGDPKTQRTDQSLTMDLLALDPFSLHLEIGKQKQEGTRPIFGSFGKTNTVELFEPIDNETLSLSLLAEYATNKFLLNGRYYYQQFDNNVDALVFDNPMRIDDALGGPSRGRIDLAPDNTYQNFSLSGSYMGLPINSRISATAAWGWMRQDDRLLPFTINPAINAPVDFSDPAVLPRQSADAQVNTTLYNILLSARPVTFLDVKGGYRFYNYDNQSDPLVFSNGYVNSDSLPILTPVSTLPVSFKKTKADMDLGFHLGALTRLNLTYAYKTTDRTNSEVEHQTDNVLGGSIDTQPRDWLGLRFSYERTMTDIGDYNYQIYLERGIDLNQLPSLRKYSQADVDRDRIAFTASLYPRYDLSLSTTLTYGRDNYSDSPYGLIDDDYYAISLDGDWTVFEGLQVHGYYTMEQYDNRQRNRSYFDIDNTGIPALTDWEARGEDVIHTLGCGIDYALVPDKLAFRLLYSISKADGAIDFNLPNGSAENFDNVNDTTLHSLDTSLRYHFYKSFALTLGFLWEKFEFDDYNQDGFTPVPTDSTGGYTGALLAGTLPRSYDAYLVYTKLSFSF